MGSLMAVRAWLGQGRLPGAPVQSLSPLPNRPCRLQATAAEPRKASGLWGFISGADANASPPRD